jgi:Ser-tRNA(Ala) deacylase AlaX
MKTKAESLKDKVIKIVDQNSAIIHVNMVTAYLPAQEALEYYKQRLHIDIDIINLVERNRWKQVRDLMEISYENKQLQTKLFDSLVSNKSAHKYFAVEAIDVERLPKTLQDIVAYIQDNYAIKQKQGNLFDIDDFNVK